MLAILDTRVSSKLWAGSSSSEGKPICTGWLVRPNYVLTAEECLYAATQNSSTRIAAGNLGQDLQIRLGYISQREQGNVFKLTLSNTEGEVAVFAVDSSAISQYDAMPFTVREPESSENAFVVQYSQDQPERLVKRACTIWNELVGFAITNSGRLMHNCDTQPGSTGSPIIAVKDNALLGMHLGGTDVEVAQSPFWSFLLSESKLRFAIMLSAALEKSKLLRDLATSR